MELRTHARTLVMASLAVASLLSATAVGVHAQPPRSPAQQDCEARGYYWDTNHGLCADLYCLDGLFGYGDPGESLVFQGRVYYCNGLTGQWTEAMRVHGNPGVGGLYPVVVAPSTQPVAAN